MGLLRWASSKARNRGKTQWLGKRQAERRTRSARFETLESRAMLAAPALWTQAAVPGDTDWANAANWSTNLVPVGTTDVVFSRPNGSDTVTNVGGPFTPSQPPPPGAEISTLSVSKTAANPAVSLTLQNDGGLQVDTNTLISSGAVTIAGTSFLDSQGGLGPNGASATISSGVAVFPYASVEVWVYWMASGGFEIGGPAAIGPSRLFLVGNGDLSTSGTIYVGNNGYLEGSARDCTGVVDVGSGGEVDPGNTRPASFVGDTRDLGSIQRQRVYFRAWQHLRGKRRRCGQRFDYRNWSVEDWRNARDR